MNSVTNYRERGIGMDKVRLIINFFGALGACFSLGALLEKRNDCTERSNEGGGFNNHLYYSPGFRIFMIICLILNVFGFFTCLTKF